MAQTWHDRPANADVETREETLASISKEMPGPAGADPSTRRHVTAKTVVMHFAWFAAAFAVTFLVVALTTGSWLFGLGMAFAIGLVASVIIPQIWLEKEDGRISDRVEADQHAHTTLPDQNADGR